MSYTRPVIIEPYYDKPEWITNEVTREEIIFLSAESSEQDVELFLILLFGYNHINIEQSFCLSFNELLKQEEVVISGGIAFFEDESKYILPSCCCGLEDFSNVIDSILNKQSPWMGHDPTPVITYIGDQVCVWQDDQETIDSNVNFHIQYSHKELIDSLNKTRKEIQGFIEGPLYEWINKRDKEIAGTMRDRMKQWIMK
ncbi:hypothetical protein B4V02_07825 [Paenibacillus kribbensis]|uniref:Uncharacterized protein n=1 Tax=Paenibacillus kribbensis TaxID=172713 RepID=A0A222WJE4_9BACL|nr:hypothetical protein [Paenibacillus kribbensis]ASR46590.1 hypothetical protein B4V02_07825 [Paenibacillus kribbensis]